MQFRWHLILTLLANLSLGIAILTFAVGFFPHKAVLPGLAEWTDDERIRSASAPFDRVIFMVVDALRSDFVYSDASQFQFAQSLIRSGAAVPFTGHASPPTITMPRVKAITTGSVPSFIDLVLNFAESDTTSTLALQDSWLAQMRAKWGGKLVMYGDDTWLRLFPGFFERADGTTSFFVSDFTEVDLNVTRHVPTELGNSDWTGMVLHFLGLDHIGHKTGPQGPNMPAKQREMDDVVKQIYTAMEGNEHLSSSLLVLLGDHGMNEGGNHGASSAGETSTALTFISPKFKNAFSGGLACPQLGVSDFAYYDVVEQSDIAPTLAALLGFPIPRNSLGIIIPKLLKLWPLSSDRFEMVYANAEQVQRIASATFSDAFSESSVGQCGHGFATSDEQDLACRWEQIIGLRQQIRRKAVDPIDATMQVTTFLHKAQSLLSGAASRYDVSKMVIGIAMSLCSTVVSGFLIRRLVSSGGFAGLAFSSMVLLYAVTMFASSYVEEEHQFWFWFTAGWLTLLVSRSAQSQTASLFTGILICLGYGITRRWNQTGQKYAGDPDLVTEILSQHPWLLWTLILATFTIVAGRPLSQIAPTWGNNRQMSILPILVTISAFLFKLTFTSADAPELLSGMSIFNPILALTSNYALVNLARVVFLGLTHLFLTCLFYTQPWTTSTATTTTTTNSINNKQLFLETFHPILSLFLIVQSRTVNIPLFLIYHFQFTLLSPLLLLLPPLPLQQQQQRNSNLLELSITSITMQYTSFFAAGGTNAISSIDLSSAYNGVRGYNVLAVGLLTFVGNWAGPVWWMSATACLLGKRKQQKKNGITVKREESAGGENENENENENGGDGSEARQHYQVLTFFMAASSLAVMLACLVLREHLFIWTVFSPRYLYAVAWVFGLHFGVDGLVGWALLG